MIYLWRRGVLCTYANVLYWVERDLGADNLLNRRQQALAEEEVERALAASVHRVHLVEEARELCLLDLRWQVGSDGREAAVEGLVGVGGCKVTGGEPLLGPLVDEDVLSSAAVVGTVSHHRRWPAQASPAQRHGAYKSFGVGGRHAGAHVVAFYLGQVLFGQHVLYHDEAV